MGREDTMVTGKMPEIEECIELLLEQIQSIERRITVSCEDCAGRILAEDVAAQINVPPFPKSAMDGYALRWEDIQGAVPENPVTLQVAGELLAGEYQEIPCKRHRAVRVMTGSFVPEGFDTVVPQENTDLGEEWVQIYAAVKQGANYCVPGEDIPRGETVAFSGTRLTSLHAGLFASLGRTQIKVWEPVKTALLSTGTELVKPGQPLSPGKIYASIGPVLASSIRRAGLTVESQELCADEEEELERKLLEALAAADIVITTGGVSVGKKDLLPAVLKKLGVKILFQGANIQPGTPTIGGVRDGKIILSLSGNPYAALANFEIYFWPLIAKMMNSDSFLVKTEKAVLDSEYPKANRLRRFIRAYGEAGRVVIPSKVHASSVISNLTECNCFIDLEPGRLPKPGELVRIRYFKEE